MTMSDDLGSLDPAGPTLTFERVYDHPIDKVWAAISDPELQAAWFPHQVLGGRRDGAALRFVTSVDPDEGFDGQMITYDPPNLIEMWWGPSLLRIELHDDGGRTRLALTEILEDLGGAARNGAGWHECLDRLAAVINHTRPPVWGQRWHETHPAYIAAFGPSADVLKAPHDWDRRMPDDPYAPRFPQHPNPTDPWNGEQ